MTVGATKPILTPAINYDMRLSSTENIFRIVFKDCSDEEWGRLLLRSLKEPVIDGLEFPSFPDQDLQSGVHGNSGVIGLREAMEFHRFVKANTYLDRETSKDMRMLDFGTGWGRMIRPFMLDFDLKNIFGFEPNFLLCCIARGLNPYCCFITGSRLPEGYFPFGAFNLITGWSIFSHLTEVLAKAWLTEMSKVLRHGGWCVQTTWGRRFLNRLIRDRGYMDEGKEINWYSQICIEAAGRGNLEEKLAAYNSGEFVWFTSGQSTTYGEAFLGSDCLQRWIRDLGLPLQVKLFDSQSLSQDVFVLQKM